MNEGRRERIKEKAYGFALGTSVPGIITVPSAIYLAVKGDFESLKGLGMVAAPIHIGWGAKGMMEIQEVPNFLRKRKVLKVPTRMSLKERFYDMPTASESVSSYIRQLHEEWELDALRNYDLNSNGPREQENKVFVEGYNHATVSTHIAVKALNDFNDLVIKSGIPL